MKNNHEWCGSCAVVFSRQLVDKVRSTDVTFADGDQQYGARCAVIAGQLVVLARRSSVAAGSDLAARLDVVDLCDSSAALTLFGWLAPVAAGETREVAAAFSEHHATPDLFDLGDGWELLQADLVEGYLRYDRQSVALNYEHLQLALSLIAR